MKNFKTRLPLIIILLLVSVVILKAAITTESELFPGENKLKSCRLTLPLTGNPLDDPYCIKAERDNRGKPIVLVHYDKKLKMATFDNYYLVQQELNNRLLFYLQLPEDYEAGLHKAVVYKYNKNTDRFYTSDCFQQVYMSDSKLQEKLVENEETHVVQSF